MAQCQANDSELNVHFANETNVHEIALAPPINLDNAELSGLTWCGDKLILLPQYPKRLSADQHSYFYYLEKSDLLQALSNPDFPPLKAKPIRINEKDIRNAVSIFDGFEAIECHEQTVWLSIEAVTLLGQYQSVLVPADIQFEPVASITIHADQLTHLPSLSKLKNMGDEAIIMHGDDIIAIHEVNDPRVVANAYARQLQRHDGTLTHIPFPSLAFRITDATKLNNDHKFWAINYKYSGDKFNRGAHDDITQIHGEGRSHKTFYNVERLLEFELKGGAISLTNSPPILLKMQRPEGRNWEGIARLDNLGFLLVTDKHPRTILAFVPLN